MSIHSKNQVSLYGKWIITKRALVNELPIHAWIEDSSEELSLSFDKDLGTVHISVIDSFGNQLYYQSLDTKDETSLVIPINKEKGEYMLSITDGRNKIYGQFSIY